MPNLAGRCAQQRSSVFSGEPWLERVAAHGNPLAGTWAIAGLAAGMLDHAANRPSSRIRRQRRCLSPSALRATARKSRRTQTRQPFALAGLRAVQCHRTISRDSGSSVLLGWPPSLLDRCARDGRQGGLYEAIGSSPGFRRRGVARRRGIPHVAGHLLNWPDAPACSRNHGLPTGYLGRRFRRLVHRGGGGLEDRGGEEDVEKSKWGQSDNRWCTVSRRNQRV
jgi:hypothetical protein